MMKKRKQKIVAGSYERFVWAWEADVSRGELRESFSRPAHLGPIKCAAGWGSDLVTGGNDDTIHIFDVRSKGKDVGVVEEAHKGSITALQFYGTLDFKATHLFSASEDGTICVWDVDSWMHLKTLKGKAPIWDFSVHPSGRLGLSVERGGGFRMWNLLRGRCSFRRKLDREASLVRFLPEKENAYALVCDNAVILHNADDARPFQSLHHDKPVLCFVPSEDKLVFTGGEDCCINAWDFRSGKLAHCLKDAHSRRIKGLDLLGDTKLLVSASSDGFVKVWDTRIVPKAGNGQCAPLMAAETKARLTCVVAFNALKGTAGHKNGSTQNRGEKMHETDDEVAEEEGEAVNADDEAEEEEEEEAANAGLEDQRAQGAKTRKAETKKKNKSKKLGVREKKIKKKTKKNRQENRLKRF